MLAAPSLGKRPVKVPNLKSLRLFVPLHEQDKGFLSKCTVLKVGLLQDHEMCGLQACMCALFSPQMFTGCGSGGVKLLLELSTKKRKQYENHAVI